MLTRKTIGIYSDGTKVVDIVSEILIGETASQLTEGMTYALVMVKHGRSPIAISNTPSVIISNTPAIFLAIAIVMATVNIVRVLVRLIIT